MQPQRLIDDNAGRNQRRGNSLFDLLEKSIAPQTEARKNILKLILLSSVNFTFITFGLVACLFVVVYINVKQRAIPTDPLLRAKYITTLQMPFLDSHVDVASRIYYDIMPSGFFKQRNTSTEGDGTCTVDKFDSSKCSAVEYDFNRTVSKELNRYLMEKYGFEVHTDIPRLRKGYVGAVFNAIYTPCSADNPVVAALEQIDIIKSLISQHTDILSAASNSEEFMANFYDGKISMLLGMEGGHMIKKSLGLLRTFSELGIRYLTLTHNCNNDIADYHATKDDKGLSEFGKQVIKEMNRLGMIIDLSHTSHKTMLDVLQLSELPVVFTHANVFKICPHTRNVQDDVIELVKRVNGVIMVSFYPIFVSEPEMKYSNSLWEKNPNMTWTSFLHEMIEWEQLHPHERASMFQVANHIDYIRNATASCDYVGIGSDFDGIDLTPSELEDVSRYQSLTAELIRRGYDDECIRKIVSGNFLRVLQKHEQARILSKNV